MVESLLSEIVLPLKIGVCRISAYSASFTVLKEASQNLHVSTFSSLLVSLASDLVPWDTTTFSPIQVFVVTLQFELSYCQSWTFPKQ